MRRTSLFLRVLRIFGGIQVLDILVQCRVEHNADVLFVERRACVSGIVDETTLGVGDVCHQLERKAREFTQLKAALLVSFSPRRRAFRLARNASAIGNACG